MRLVSRRRWAMLPAVAVLATVGAIAPMTPAAAAANDAGVIVATGWVTLPAFPTRTLLGPPAPTTAPPANFCVDGVVTTTTVVPSPTLYADGVADPTTGGPPTICTLAGPSLTATITYDEPCPPAIGFAKGTLTLAGTGGAEYYFWVRVGLSSILLISDTPYASPVTGAPSQSDILSSDGAAVAVFVPVPAGVPACPGPAVTAYVAAAGAWA